MASNLIKIGKSDNIPICTYNVDTEEDMNTIDLQDVPMGSKCYIINDGKWYMLNSEGKWITISGAGSGGSGGCDLSDSDILEALIATNMLHAVADGDGALLADEKGNVLVW